MKAKLSLTVFLTMCCFLARSQATNDAFSFSSTTESKKVWASKNNVINIYPNPSTTGEVSINSKTDQLLHFYIFDLEGTLIYQVVLKTKDKKAVTNLNKGTYMYNVFVNDESIEEGKLIIR